jgi:hypothetical protein
MMTRRNLFRYVDAEPFKPFRIKMTSGETFEIRHPENIAVSRTTAHVFTWMSEDDEDSKEREREISIILIESIEPLKPANKQDQSQN